jgi:hypothetical protein
MTYPNAKQDASVTCPTTEVPRLPLPEVQEVTWSEWFAATYGNQPGQPSSESIGMLALDKLWGASEQGHTPTTLKAAS